MIILNSSKIIFMPELPEVETIRRDLEKEIVGQKIVSFWSERGKVVRGNYKKMLEGAVFEKIDRRGKLLMFGIAGTGKTMLVHLKMTGQLIYLSKENMGPSQSSRIVAGGHSFRQNDFDLPGKHTRAVFEFENGGKLFFNDMRKFGYIEIVDSKDKENIMVDKFGIEPGLPHFTLENFRDVIKNRQTSIKAVLLNQKLIAGIGNIYADESCFEAGIKPERVAKSLNDREIKKLWQAVKKIIQKAIQKRGTTFNNYVDVSGNKGNFVSELKVYGRGGEKCQRCGATLRKGKVVGRGTVWCEECQN